MMTKIKMFSMAQYVQAALKQARYEADENEMILASVLLSWRCNLGCPFPQWTTL